MLANACVMQRVYLSSHFVSFRNISQNCPMPSSPVNVSSVNDHSILRTSPFQGAENPTIRLAFGGCVQTLALCSVSVLAVTLCRLVVNLRNGEPRGILCTRGEKAHTSKRVNIIACNNVISKVQLPGTPRDIVYPRGKGAHKHKSEHCRKRQCDFKSAVCAVSSPVNVTPVNVLNRYALTASEERSKRLHLRKSNAADIANNRIRSVKCKALAQSTDNNNFPLSLLYLLKIIL